MDLWSVAFNAALFSILIIVFVFAVRGFLVYASWIWKQPVERSVVVPILMGTLFVFVLSAALLFILNHALVPTPAPAFVPTPNPSITPVVYFP